MKEGEKEREREGEREKKIKIKKNDYRQTFAKFLFLHVFKTKRERRN